MLYQIITGIYYLHEVLYIFVYYTTPWRLIMINLQSYTGTIAPSFPIPNCEGNITESAISIFTPTAEQSIRFKLLPLVNEINSLYSNEMERLNWDWEVDIENMSDSDAITACELFLANWDIVKGTAHMYTQPEQWHTVDTEELSLLNRVQHAAFWEENW